MRSFKNILCASTILVALAAATPVAERQSTYPDPIPCTGPACFHFQDCNVIIGPPAPNSGDRYYRWSKGNNTGDGIQLATAPTLRGPWNFRGTVITGNPIDPIGHNDRGHTHFWAPQVNQLGDTYYMTYGLYNPARGFDIAIATSKTMALGSWTDHGSIGIPKAPAGTSFYKTYTRLGASMMCNSSDPSGVAPSQHYLAFGSYATALYGVKMGRPPLKIAPGAVPTELIRDQPVPKLGGNMRTNRTEGPFIYKRSPTHYYVFYSRGNCCAGANAPVEVVYRIEVCRAGKVAGPYYDRSGLPCGGSASEKNGSGTTVLESHGDVFEPGSLGILRDPTEGLVMYYQYRNVSSHKTSSMGRTFGFNHLMWTDDDWPYLA